MQNLGEICVGMQRRELLTCRVSDYRIFPHVYSVRGNSINQQLFLPSPYLLPSLQHALFFPHFNPLWEPKSIKNKLIFQLRVVLNHAELLGNCSMCHRHIISTLLLCYCSNEMAQTFLEVVMYYILSSQTNLCVILRRRIAIHCNILRGFCLPMQV